MLLEITLIVSVPVGGLERLEGGHLLTGGTRSTEVFVWQCAHVDKFCFDLLATKFLNQTQAMLLSSASGSEACINHVSGSLTPSACWTTISEWLLFLLGRTATSEQRLPGRPGDMFKDHGTVVLLHFRDLPGLIDLILSGTWSVFFLSAGASILSWGACKASALCLGVEEYCGSLFPAVGAVRNQRSPGISRPSSSAHGA